MHGHMNVRLEDVGNFYPLWESYAIGITVMSVRR